MSAGKSERLMNLLILLMVSRQYLSKQRIREAVEDYRDKSDEAFEKMFERDKDDLRALGVPIEVGSFDAYFDDEQGYRVPRDGFLLPALDLEPDEAAVVGLAAQVWADAGRAKDTSAAVLKLKAAGVDVDRGALDVVQPRLGADEPCFDDVWDATTTRTPIRFGYRRSDAAEFTERHVEPWGMVTASGRWYVVGHDRDRNDSRMFRLSRFRGPVIADGPVGSVEVPPGTDLRALASRLKKAPPTATARLWIREGAGFGLRGRGRVVATDVDRGGVTGDEIEIDYAGTEAMADEVLGALDAVVVIGPADLRELVIERLTELVNQ